MTEKELREGKDCYTNRPTWLWTNEKGDLRVRELPPPQQHGGYGYWFCGRRDPDGSIHWC